MKKDNAITDVPGIKVGHAQNEQAHTGCTVILCTEGAVAGMDSRGGGTSTRQTDSLDPMHLVHEIQAVLLSGGSAFGLEAATGVMNYLEENGVGFEYGNTYIPSVPTAILFDLGLGDSNIRPDAKMGYQACLNASTTPPAQGNYGAGTGATVGKILGLERAMKSGIGTSSIWISEDLVVGAIAAVNASGDVIDPSNGKIVAGTRAFQSPLEEKEGTLRFADSLKVMKDIYTNPDLYWNSRENTVIGVVATNAKLNKVQSTKIAQMAQDGLARTIRPAHTMFDGDTIFSLATGKIRSHPKMEFENPSYRHFFVNLIGSFAAEAFAQAVLSAIYHAKPVLHLPSARK